MTSKPREAPMYGAVVRGRNGKVRSSEGMQRRAKGKFRGNSSREAAILFLNNRWAVYIELREKRNARCKASRKCRGLIGSDALE